MEIIGIERVDYVSRKNNRPVKGYTFYCIGVKSAIIGGSFCDNYFVNDDNVKSLLDTVNGDISALIGVEVRPYRNKFGDVEQLDRLG